MFRSLFTISLVTAGCSTMDPLEESPFGGNEEVGCDTGSEAEISDSGVDSDTAIDDSGTDDTAPDTGNTFDCDSITVDGAGLLADSFGNDIRVSNAGIAPEQYTANQAIFAGFTVTSLYTTCESLVITEVPIEVLATGTAPSQLFVLDEDSRYNLAEGIVETNEEGELVGRLEGALVIAPGATKTFVIYGDPRDINEGGTVRVDVKTRMRVYDVDSWTYFENEEVAGGEYVNK